MSALIRYELPDTRDQIVASLEAVHVRANVLWHSFSDREFFAAPPDGGWSPAQNVAHLIQSTSPVTRALGLPRFALRLLFGSANIPSRSFVEVRAAYRAVLADGAQAAGRYAPREKRPQAGGMAQSPQPLLDKWQRLVPKLNEAIRTWDDSALDRYRLPRPLLGKLTLREMLFFTLYHVGHHASNVLARQTRGTGAVVDAPQAE